MNNVHMHIFIFDDIHATVLAPSKARVRYDMSNKQSLSFEKGFWLRIAIYAKRHFPIFYPFYGIILSLFYSMTT